MAKILVVDDSPMILEYMGGFITKFGHEPVLASNGYEGLKALKRNKDCVLVFADVHMPDMNGLAMVKKIIVNEGGFFPVVPIMMLTTEDDENVQTMAQLAGVQGWLTKPLSPEKLKEILGTV